MAEPARRPAFPNGTEARCSLITGECQPAMPRAGGRAGQAGVWRARDGTLAAGLQGMCGGGGIQVSLACAQVVPMDAWAYVCAAWFTGRQDTVFSSACRSPTFPEAPVPVQRVQPLPFFTPHNPGCVHPASVLLAAGGAAAGLVSPQCLCSRWGVCRARLTGTPAPSL